MTSNRRAAHRVRQWRTGVGLAGTAAAMIGVACAAVAHADTPDDVIEQAIQDLNQGTAVLDAAPTADLSAHQAAALADAEALGPQVDPLLTQIGSVQEGLSAADQPFLANADEQLVSAAQNLMSFDQAFVAADQAGDLSSSGLLPVDLTGAEADLGLLAAGVDAYGATILAAFDPDIGTLSALAAAATTSADPADLLSEATTTLTDGNEVLNSIDVSGLDPNLASTIPTQVGFEDHAIFDIGNLASAENLISSNDGAFSTVVNDLLTPVDQGIYQSTEAILAADQALDVALSTDSGAIDPAALVAELGLIAPDYQLLGDIINALPIDWVGSLF